MFARFTTGLTGTSSHWFICSLTATVARHRPWSVIQQLCAPMHVGLAKLVIICWDPNSVRDIIAVPRRLGSGFGFWLLTPISARLKMGAP